MKAWFKDRPHLKLSSIESSADVPPKSLDNYLKGRRPLKDEHRQKIVEVLKLYGYGVEAKGTVKRSTLQSQDKPDKYPLDWGIFSENLEFLEAWTGYVNMRKKKKKPTTTHICNLVLGLVIKHSSGDVKTAIQILNQSSIQGYTNIYPLKKNNHEQLNSGKGIPDSEDEYTTAAQSLA